MKKYILSANVSLGLLIALSPFVLFPVCQSLRPDGTHMSCHYSGVFITVMGVLVALSSLLSLWRRNALWVVLAGAGGVSCLLVPYRVIGLCAMSEHACRASTMPAVWVMSCLVVVLCVVYLAVNFVSPNR